VAYQRYTILPAVVDELEVGVAEELAVTAERQPLSVIDDEQPGVTPRESADVTPARAALGRDRPSVAVEVVSFDFRQAEDVVVAELLGLLSDPSRDAAVTLGIPGEDS
jgi:hypothetical protein